MTVLGLTRSDRVVLWLGLPIVGVALGWFAPSLARLAIEHSPFVPIEWAVRLVQNSASWMTALAGAVVGAALAAAAERETVRLTVTDESVGITLKGASRTYRREQIHAVRLDGKQLVLEAGNGAELARQKPEGRAEVVEQAFRTHGYPWV